MFLGNFVPGPLAGSGSRGGGNNDGRGTKYLYLGIQWVAKVNSITGKGTKRCHKTTESLMGNFKFLNIFYLNFLFVLFPVVLLFPFFPFFFSPFSL